MAGTKQRQTPGVYITELDAFPPSVVGVATAVPAFIGYTQKAVLGGQAIPFKPVKIASRADYDLIFGGGGSGFNLYDSIQLFYANGGGTCYVLSVGDDTEAAVDADKLMQGLTVVGEMTGPTMIAIPDAVLLPPDPVAPSAAAPAIPRSAAYQTLVRAMLAQSGTLRDRMALLDPYGAQAIDAGNPASFQASLDICTANFREDVGEKFLGYGAAYFPLLQVGAGVVGQFKLLPASGAMAGLYTFNDTSRGVWNAPANLLVEGIVALSLKINAEQQGPLNVPLDGKAINVIRDFTGRGPVVWGARTLDGNSLDYRYIQVRRTLIYIEQSIKTGLQPFVFAPNDAGTWTTVTAMVSNFLQGLWSQGGLMGAKASDAYTVACGLGSTMTPQDILNGYMIVQVTLQMVRPAEFIELTITQKMQGIA